MRRSRVVAWIAVSAAGWACPSSGEEVPFVPGEVIIRFRAGTPAARATSEAAAAAGTAEAVLAPQIRALSDGAGVPLRLKRLSSGGDVLLAVDAGRLQQKLLKALRGSDGVAQVDPTGEAPSRGEPRGGVRVRFAASSRAARDVSRAAALAAGETPLEPLDVTRQLQSRVGFPLANRLGQFGVLVIEPDLAALAREVVRRLSERPDIQYAELNHIVRALRP